MTPEQKAPRIQAILEDLFPRPAVTLQHRDPFTLLVATVLSAQSTDKKVNEITPALFARAPSPAAMAGLPLDELRELIRVVGLANTKARNLSSMASQLEREHRGEVPADFASLEALPGVGHKTASVVMAAAFGQPAFPVDTHIHRLAWRWGLSEGRDVKQTERDLKALFPPESWYDLHLQIIYFGRAHCPALRHAPQACPICSWAGVPGRLTASRAPRRSSPRR